MSTENCELTGAPWACFCLASDLLGIGGSCDPESEDLGSSGSGESASLELEGGVSIVGASDIE